VLCNSSISCKVACIRNIVGTVPLAIFGACFCTRSPWPWNTLWSPQVSLIGGLLVVSVLGLLEKLDCHRHYFIHWSPRLGCCVTFEAPHFWPHTSSIWIKGYPAICSDPEVLLIRKLCQSMAVVMLFLGISVTLLTADINLICSTYTLMEPNRPQMTVPWCLLVNGICDLP